VLRKLDFRLPFYFKYVDDILTAVLKTAIDSIVDKFNVHHPRLQFTVEIGGDRINFLDTTIIKNNNKLIFDWYHKATYSGIYILFRHPLCQKKGTIFGLVDRMFMLWHPSFHQKNLELIVKILLENDYPLNFIFKIILNRIRHLLHNMYNMASHRAQRSCMTRGRIDAYNTHVHVFVCKK